MLHTVYVQVDFLEFNDAGVEKFCDSYETERGQTERLAEELRFEATLNGEGAFREERWIDASATRKVALAIDDRYPKPEREEDDRVTDEDESSRRTTVERTSADPNFRWEVEFDDQATVSLRFALSREAADSDARVYARVDQDIELKPYEEQAVVIPTADYKLYVSVLLPGAAEVRKATKDIQPSRQYLDSSAYTSIVRPRPPMIRPILFSPTIGTASAANLNSEIDKKNYTGASGEKLAPDSVEARLRYLIDAMNAAHTEVNGSLKSAETRANASGHRVINIFLGPEWYFRHTGKPLTESEMINAMEGVREESRKEKWRRWLIVPGSCYWGRPLEWASPLKKSKLKKRILGAQAATEQIVHRWSVFNTIFVFHNGRMIHMYTKQYEADIDEKRRTAESWGMSDATMRESTLYDAHEASHFEFNGIHFGIEICRDHNTCRLVREIDGKGVDVHLLAASNVDWKTERIGARDHGYFLYADSGKGTREAHEISTTSSTDQRGALFREAVQVFDDGNRINQQIIEWEQKKAAGVAEAGDRIQELGQQLRAAMGTSNEFRSRVLPVVSNTKLTPVWSNGRLNLDVYDVLELKPPRR